MSDRFAGILSLSGITDVGLRRSHNEDAFGIYPALGLILVCDGMGGHDGGEIASALAVETISEFLRAPPPSSNQSPVEKDAGEDETVVPGRARGSSPAADAERLQHAVTLANARILHENQSRGFEEGTGMGTTIAATAGFIAQIAGDEAEAKTLFQKALETDSESYEALIGLGTITYFEGQEEDGKAIIAPTVQAEDSQCPSSPSPVAGFKPGLGFAAGYPVPGGTGWNAFR